MEREIETPHGIARARLVSARGPVRAGLMLGHGAGGGPEAPDLAVATEAATALGVHVALIEQPYRVAGRRAPAPASQLDAAWLAVVSALRTDWFAGLPLIFGGRSSGARVACRTSAEGAASGVLCLSFPEHPPGKPERSRMNELDAVDVPVLIVQGRRDPFGCPPDAPGRDLVVLDGDHALKADLPGVSSAVTGWLKTMYR